MPNRLLSIEEVAHYLHVERPDVEQLVKREEIPFEHKGDRPVFRRSEIDAWASRRILGLSPRQLHDYHRATTAKTHSLARRHAIITELTAPDRCEPELASRTRAAVLHDLAALAEATCLLYDREGLLRSLREREELCTTALPGGIAIPHPRHHDPFMLEDSFLVVARTVTPIHFGAEDGKPTDLFFLICCQEDRLHLHVLARLCAMCLSTAFLEALRNAPDADALHQAVVSAEQDVIGNL